MLRWEERVPARPVNATKNDVARHGVQFSMLEVIVDGPDPALMLFNKVGYGGVNCRL